MVSIVKANSAGNSGRRTPATAKPDVQLIPAISDADGPEPRSFAWQLKAGEEQQFTKQLQGFARADLAKFEKPRLPNFASAELDPGSFRVFDVDLSNEPTFVYVAPARIFTGAALAHARARARTAPASISEIQAYVTVVAKMDLYGEVRQIFSSVTDSRHLDEFPRLELVDASGQFLSLDMQEKCLRVCAMVEAHEAG